VRRVLTRGAVLLAALSFAGLARAVEPGEAAIAFLKLLQKEERTPAELLEATILSPHCGELRRRVISQRLGRLGRHMRVNGFDFEVVGEKRDGEFTAVLLSAVSKHDPLEVDVVAIGLRKGKEAWGVAPVPGSFDNVHLGFNEGLEQRVNELDLWMGTERLKKLRKLHSAVEHEFRKRMAKAVPAELLEKANPIQVVEAFVKACLDGNIEAAMVLQGRFDEAPTEEDRKLQQVMSRGLQGLDRRKHWRLLTSPDVVRVVVQEDPGDDLDAEVVILLFDPGLAEPTNLLRFVLLRSGKRWEIELPTSLRLADEDRLRFQRAIWRERDSDDAEMRKRFEEHFENKHKPRRHKDLREAGNEIEKTLREGSLEEFFAYLHRGENLSESERRTAYRYLGEFWNGIHEDDKTASDGELVEVIEHEDAGVLVFHRISTQLDNLKLVPLLLMREEGGWAIAPGVTTDGNYAALDEKRRARQREADAMFGERKDELSKKAVQGFLERFVPATPKEGGVVGEDEAGALVKTFRTRLRDGCLLEAFDCCALLDPAEGAWEALKSLSYEYRGAQQAKEPDRELAVDAGRPWGAVSLRVDSGPSSVPDYPMYLVVATEKGPRIVVDAGLRLATNKAHQVLNKSVWDRIEAQLEEKETKLVQELFQGHVDRSRTNLAEWEKSNKSSP